MSKKKRKIARQLKRKQWEEQERPMFTARNIHYEIAEKGQSIACGGIGAIHQMVIRSGLVKEIDENLELLKTPIPKHVIVSLANFREVLYIENHPGNVPSHSGATEWIDRAIELVKPHAKKVCVRGDTDFSLTGNFDRWSEQVDFVFGVDARGGLIKRQDC